jgi:PIN domain nuclease of toxin-antitoxin system
VIHLLDTSALKWVYIPGRKHTRRCRTIVSRRAGAVFIAEITFLEIISPLGGEVRAGRMSVREFDRANTQFMKDIAEGRIQVYPLPASEYVSCRYLLTSVGITRQRALKSQDGIVAYTALRLARESKTRVKLLTSDKGLAGVVRDLDLFSRLVDAEYLDPN